MKKFWKKKEKSFKECPRCGMRNLISADECIECKLVFSRMQFATNRDAKRKLKRGDREFIIMSNDLPSDVSFLKLLLACIFGGLFGVHSFRVGRYVRGIFPLISTSALILFTIFNEPMILAMGESGFGALSTCVGFFMMMWPIDIVLILMKKFKVPVAIDIDAKDEMEHREAELERLKQEDEQEKTQTQEENDVEKAKQIRQEVLHDVNKMKEKKKRKGENS